MANNCVTLSGWEAMIFVIFMTNYQITSILSHIRTKIILSKLTSPAKLCSLTLFDALVNILCGNNLNTIDLFINIYDSISLSPIILMERNFKSDPDPRYETNKNGKLY